MFILGSAGYLTFLTGYYIDIFVVDFEGLENGKVTRLTLEE